MLVAPHIVLLFGLCCAISTGHLFTGVMGFTLGRQRSELNALFAALTICAAWIVFWLGAYQVFPIELIARVRFASQLLSGYVGPLLLLFCWGVVRFHSGATACSFWARSGPSAQSTPVFIQKR